MSFVFSGDYNDKEQVREWVPEYKAIRDDLESRGQYPHNDRFKGRIEGIAGEDEDTAIYLLQNLHAIGQEHARIDALLAEGFETLEGLS